MKLPVWTIR